MDDLGLVLDLVGLQCDGDRDKRLDFFIVVFEGNVYRLDDLDRLVILKLQAFIDLVVDLSDLFLVNNRSDDHVGALGECSLRCFNKNHGSVDDITEALRRHCLCEVRRIDRILIFRRDSRNKGSICSYYLSFHIGPVNEGIAFVRLCDSTGSFCGFLICGYNDLLRFRRNSTAAL